MKLSSVRQWLAGVKHDAKLTINIEEAHGQDKLNRQLGLISVVLFTITQAVGAGILTTPGIIARDYAGPFGWMSFLWAGLICAPAALCLAKMASMTSRSGSTGSYACLVLGQFVGFLMFFDVMLECLGGTAAVAVSQADHIKMILRIAFGVHLPDAVTKTPEIVQWGQLGCAIAGGITAAILLNLGWKHRSAVEPGKRFRTYAGLTLGAGAALFGMVSTVSFVAALPSINLLSMAVVGLITVILLRGIKETAFLTNLFTITKLIVVTFIVFLLAQHYDPANLALPVPDKLPGALAGASIAFFAFVGLDLATMTSGETKNAKRNVPLGMLIGLVAVTVMYVVAAYFLSAAVPYTLIGAGGHEEAAPMAQALELLGYKSAVVWVALGSTVALVSVLLASAYSTTRLVYNMAQHKLLPEAFEKVSAKRQVPVLATLMVGGGVALLTGLLAVGELMHLTNIGTMTAFITISLTVLIKTVRDTNWKNRAELRSGIFWIFVAALGVLGSGRLLIELPWEAFARLLVIWAGVTLLFVFYSRHRSLARIQNANRLSSEKREDRSAD